jgi:D-alanyl-D-alanine carboxypeptidase (penicillin-binding protein 5/6)
MANRRVLSARKRALLTKRLLQLLLIVCVLILSVRIGGNLFSGHQVVLPKPQPQSAKVIPLQPQPEVTAQGAILINPDNGQVLYSKNASSQLYPASTTKMLTALVAIENCDLNKMVTVGDEIKMVPADASKAGLRVGESMSMRDLIYGMMLPSGADAAYAIAVNVARDKKGSQSLDARQAVAVFATMMNERAKKAGALHSNFCNPEGYQDENQFTTAGDLAKIAKSAMKSPTFRQVVGSSEYTVAASASIPKALVWKNTNRLVNQDSSYYLPEATGIKTGNTTPAGHCLVSSASKDGVNLIAVVLDCGQQTVWTDSYNLLTYGFSCYLKD